MACPPSTPLISATFNILAFRCSRVLTDTSIFYDYVFGKEHASIGKKKQFTDIELKYEEKVKECYSSMDAPKLEAPVRESKESEGEKKVVTKEKTAKKKKAPAKGSRKQKK